jgi:sarcosine oxidase subunit beta
MRVAIIGSGIVGLSAAYNLASSAEVIVFERRYPLYGASGRNSGGVTTMLPRKELIELARRSIKIYDKIQSEVKFNFLFRKDGYLKVAGTDLDMLELESEYRMHRACGVRVKEVDPFEIREIVPGFNPESVAGGFFGEGGVIFPWPVIWGYRKGCEAKGVDIKTQTTVSELVFDGKEIRGLRAGGEFYKADFVVNAAGAWSNEINELAGVKLRNEIMKEEICVIETLKPFINPYILNVSSGVYFTQTIRGEIDGGVIGERVSAVDTSSSIDFLIRYAKGIAEMMPFLKGLAVLRQWAGVYDCTRDELPIIGESLNGFVQANGLGRYGMSIGPAVGELVADIILKGKSFDEFSPDRLI